MVEIKFCENNFTHGTDVTIEKLKDNFEDVNVLVEACLGYCGDCAEGPFALVDDEFVQGESAEDLYDRITELL